MPIGWEGIVVAVLMLAVFGMLFRHEDVRLFKARDYLLRGALLVDVDSAAEFARHHPRVGLSVPLKELVLRAKEISPENSIVVFAHSWLRGVRATNLLVRLGYRDVFNAAGLRSREKLAAAMVTRAEIRRNEREQTEIASPTS